jgi:putative membrane protein
VINGIIILVADYLLDEFYVSNFWWAFLFSVILSLINSILNNMLGTNPKKEEEEQDHQRLQ